MLFGILHLTVVGYCISTILLTQFTVACVTLYLHRCQAHRAIELHPIISHIFRFWLWLTTGINTREWVAVHRKHHAKCETVEDPHSPQILGLSKVFFLGYFVYQKAAKNTETVQTYGHGTSNDWIERNLYSHHGSAGIVFMLVIDLLLFGIIGLAIWAIQMIWIPVFAGGVVNGIGHYWGYRNFACPDASTNLIPLAIFAGGEELHNNHHAYASSAKLSMKWWEFDIGWLYICLLRFFGLAKVKRLSAKIYQQTNKTIIDLDTVTAIFANRFQVITRYTHEVLLPTLKQESRKMNDFSQDLWHRTKTLLLKPESLLSEANKEQITNILASNHVLKLVHHYANRLQNIWNQPCATTNELIQALQDWCIEAETTGISVLRDFAIKLRGYSFNKEATT
jgi:stearoyl-CoA desaturase (delta-9 desaturase)